MHETTVVSRVTVGLATTAMVALLAIQVTAPALAMKNGVKAMASAAFSAQGGDRIRVVLDNLSTREQKVRVVVLVSASQPRSPNDPTDGFNGKDGGLFRVHKSETTTVPAGGDVFFDIFLQADLGEYRWRVAVVGGGRGLSPSVQVNGPNDLFGRTHEPLLYIDSFFDVFFPPGPPNAEN